MAATIGAAGCGGQTAPRDEAVCSETHETIGFTLDSWLGNACNAPNATLSTQVTGRVVATTSRSMDVDTCLPCNTCEVGTITLTVDSASLPGLDAIFPIGAPVRIDVTRDSFFGCHQALLVTDATDACSSPNPPVSPDQVYLAFGDGILGGPSGPNAPDAPFGAVPLPLGCSPNAGPNCGGTQYAVDSYALEIGAAGSSNAIRVAMGHTETLDLGNGVVWTIRNLRSFQTELCDDYWNWAFWIARLK